MYFVLVINHHDSWYSNQKNSCSIKIINDNDSKKVAKIYIIFNHIPDVTLKTVLY